jgi:hypothetical protein
MKKTKLTEKPSCIPDIAEVQITQFAENDQIQTFKRD